MSKKITEIKILNIAQPYAHFVFQRGKNVENRTMAANFRGTIAIYASKTKRSHFFDDQAKPKVKPEDCSFGAIIGLVDLVDCITSDHVSKKTKKWFGGPLGYVFENPRYLKKPIHVSPPKGAVIWWTLSGPVLSKVLSQINQSKIIPITKVQVSEETKVNRRSKRRVFLPSKDLAKIIGDGPFTINQCLKELYKYIETNDLFIDEEDAGFKTDASLRKIFKLKNVDLSDVGQALWDNLKKAS